ncbi:MAG TPA: hypothetical protein DD827_01930, partial [Gammaproteobacteria bacterium]|nr:hypothetical protein [Gammaproteobacteria bacterium]
LGIDSKYLAFKRRKSRAFSERPSLRLSKYPHNQNINSSYGGSYQRQLAIEPITPDTQEKQG